MMPYYMQRIYKIMLRNNNLNNNLAQYIPTYDVKSPGFLRNLAVALEKAEAEVKADQLRQKYQSLPGLDGLDFIV